MWAAVSLGHPEDSQVAFAFDQQTGKAASKQNQLKSLFCLSSTSRLEVTGRGQLGAPRMNLATAIRQQGQAQMKELKEVEMYVLLHQSFL